MAMQHTPGEGKVTIGAGAARKTFEKTADGRLEFDLESPVYGKVSFIDLWLCGGFEGNEEADPEQYENEELRRKIASAESRGTNLFEGFEQEIEAGEADGVGDIAN